MIRYELPPSWAKFEFSKIAQSFVDAKSAVNTLRALPYQRGWVEELQAMELRREVAGTSRIEGADFTERELDEAMKAAPEQLLTRSQKQAHAAAQTYRWLAQIPDDRPIDSDLIREIHRRIVTGADDDHCPPGQLRRRDENVNFGTPRHRGAEGGEECERAFAGLVWAIGREFGDLDPLLQGLAAHYHFAAMHPFLDGNGRTARALEALMLRRAGLRDACFVSISNYYYEEKTKYLAALVEARAGGHDLTPFLDFALKGIGIQAKRIASVIKGRLEIAVFRDLATELFTRLTSPKKRLIAERQLKILEILLEVKTLTLGALMTRLGIGPYLKLKAREKAVARDLFGLRDLGCLEVALRADKDHVITIVMDWPERFTESELYELARRLPKARSGALSSLDS